MNPQLFDYDLIIVGAGMVGATLACALGEAGFKVAVVETKPAQHNSSNDEYDPRVSSINGASQRIFQALGVWQRMCDRRVSPYEHMHVWDEAGDGVIHFDCAEIGEPSLGHIVENRVIEGSLLERIQVLDTVTLYCPAQALDIQHTSGFIMLTLAHDQVLRAKLLVGADGARSWVRGQVGIAVSSHDYQQKALVATVKTSKHHQDTAWQRFLKTGPLAFLPLTNGYSSIVWSTSHDEAERLASMDTNDFKSSLAEAFDHRLGEITEVATRTCIPLKSQHAEHYVLNRLALVGDAAHTIHPLAGQGVNLGLADAAALAEVLIGARAAGKDLGSVKVLRRYERWRRGDNSAMGAAMTGFWALFGNELPLVKRMRNSGLNLANNIQPLKHLFMRYAMGLVGDLPRLSRHTHNN